MTNKSLEKECLDIIDWKHTGRTPCSIFGFEDYKEERNLLSQMLVKSAPPYTEDQIKTTYKQLQVKFHPDKNRTNPHAQTAFQVITAARDYLLYTLKRQPSDIMSNPFYLHDNTPAAAPTQKKCTFTDEFQKTIAQIYISLRNYEDNITSYFDTLSSLIKEHPQLIAYECDDRHINLDVAYKNILYCAAQWNKKDFFKTLLDMPGADPLATTLFGISPLGIALINDHYDIIQVLVDKNGTDWLQAQLMQNLFDQDTSYYESVFDCYQHFFDCKLDITALQSKEYDISLLQDRLMQKLLDKDTRTFDYGALLSCFNQLFPASFNINSLQTQNPCLLPTLLAKGYITSSNSTELLKSKIIGCPKLFVHLPEKLKKDPFFIVATLAQDRSSDMISKINFKELVPAFCFALGEQWPEELAFTVEQALHKNAPPYNNFTGYVGFRSAIIATIIYVIIGLLALHFWPIIALLAPTTILGMALASTSIVPPLFIYMYLEKTYPETRKINHILRENNFFKPAAPEPTTDTDKIPETMLNRECH